MPVVGFLRSTTATSSAHLVAAFRQGLNEVGFVEGQSVVVDTAGPTIRMIGCRDWWPRWFAAV
jgi:hypothetical protein